MAWVWTVFLAVSLITAVTTGRTAALASAVMTGSGAGVTLALELAGPICLWSGLAGVMEESGWMRRLAVMVSPVLSRLFPCAWRNAAVREAICGNLSANLLGLGNAATPMGIRAAKLMAAESHGEATNELCRLVVMNTASLQLIPATVAAVRASLGCQTPFDILPAVWLTSVCSVSIGLLAAGIFSGWA